MLCCCVGAGVSGGTVIYGSQVTEEVVDHSCKGVR